MNIALAVIKGVLGLAAGFFVPLLAQKIITYKYAEKNEALAENKYFTGMLLKVGSSVINGAGWAMITYYFVKNPLPAVLLGLLWTMAIIIAVIDLKIHMIPNELVLILAILGIIFQLCYFGAVGLLYAVISMIAVMAAFTLLASMMGFSSVGAGDVKLAGAMGLALGYPYILHGLIGMSLFMIAYCIIGMLIKKLTLKSMLPFAPFMMTGMVVAIIEIILGY